MLCRYRSGCLRSASGKAINQSREIGAILIYNTNKSLEVGSCHHFSAVSIKLALIAPCLWMHILSQYHVEGTATSLCQTRGVRSLRIAELSL